MINAFLVAHVIPPKVVQARNTYSLRNYTKGNRPTFPCIWTNLTLVEYSYNIQTKMLDFKIV